MPTITTAPELVTLKGGLVVSVDALRVLWDLEDRGMVNSQSSWSSNVDGALGTGRMKALPDLSVGFHTITVTATDFDGMTSTDTTNIEIKPQRAGLAGDHANRVRGGAKGIAAGPAGQPPGGAERGGHNRQGRHGSKPRVKARAQPSGPDGRQQRRP